MKADLKTQELKEKIVRTLKTSTPKGSRYAPGASWSVWNTFVISKEEGELYLKDKSFLKFMATKCGTPYAYSALLIHIISIHPSLSIHILNSDKKSHLYHYKAKVILNGLYDYEINPSMFNDSDVAAKTEYLRVCPIDEVKLFLKDQSDKVRIEAYNRMGLLSCAEEMTKDKSARVRAAICHVLPCNHPALNNLINDRSKWVFASVLKKIDKSKIPMMLGSRHLKESFVNLALNKRMSNLGET
jgi:hypothetical protein